MNLLTPAATSVSRQQLDADFRSVLLTLFHRYKGDLAGKADTLRRLADTCGMVSYFASLNTLNTRLRSMMADVTPGSAQELMALMEQHICLSIVFMLDVRRRIR